MEGCKEVGALHKSISQQVGSLVMLTKSKLGSSFSKVAA